MMGRSDSVTLAKQTESFPTRASPRLPTVRAICDLRPEKGKFTRMSVKFTFYEFQVL